MNNRTYQFYETGVIPGIPGEWHAGLLVDVDEDTMTVLGTRLMHAPTAELTAPISPEPEQTQQEELPATAQVDVTIEKEQGG